MGCTCTTCESHWRMLDLAEAPASIDQLREAYLDAVKVWHPDRFEGDARLRAKAENRFKSVQVAYRELLEHLERPETAQTAATAESSQYEADQSSYDVFSRDDRCYVSPYIPHNVRTTVGNALGGRPQPDLLVVIDLSGNDRKHIPRDLSRFLALSPQGVSIKDESASGFLRYDQIDPARLTLEDHGQAGLSGWWPRGKDPMGAQRPRYSLEIFRRDGQHIFTLDTPASDAVKKATFDFIKARIPVTRSA